MKVYAIKKYIAAESLEEALKKEKRSKVSEIFLTEDSFRAEIFDKFKGK